MEQLRRVLETIRKQLTTMTPKDRLLIASGVVVLLMALFLVSQYAGSPERVDLLPGSSPEEQTRAAAYLDSIGFSYTMDGGALKVPAEQKYVALARLGGAQQLPADTRLTFSNLADKQSWLMTQGQLTQMNNTALQNELAMVISSFPGIRSANVFISVPESKGFGQAAKMPVAQVTVFPQSGSALSAATVDALASMVAGAVSGLDPRNVAVVDGVRGRTHRISSEDDFGGGGGGGGATYLEQAAAVEQRLQNKISEHLSYMGGVIVSVNAVIDAARRDSVTVSTLPKNEGTVSVPKNERETSSQQQSASRGAEPGVQANTAADINYAGGAGTTSVETSSETEYETVFGKKEVREVDARGKPLRINVIASVPRDWVVQVIKQAKGDPEAQPTEAEVTAAWPAEQERIRSLLKPLVQTEAGKDASVPDDDIVVTMIPVAMASLPGPMAMAGLGGGGGGLLSGGGGGGGGLLGSVSALAQSGLVKTAFVGVLAVVSLGMMLMMVRKAGKAAPVPTAEELVGIPPALQSSSDLVGEADESDTAMVGIEIGSEELKTQKMLEEVGELVKTNPQGAASVLGRWLITDE